jgi:SAM-dependent methyltransferase
MPRTFKTIVPRIRRSLRDRGILGSLSVAFSVPGQLLRERAAAGRMTRPQRRSDFDLAHNVDTDGDFDDWTHLSDLNIDSPNWIDGTNYTGIESVRFDASVSALDIRFEDFTFIDFGSGKGRALLLASELPFKLILGVEFSPELHATAQRNLQTYATTHQQCRSIDLVCMDFVDFQLPPEPSVLFFYDPCTERVFRQVLRNVEASLRECPRPIYLIYIVPGSKGPLLDSAPFLTNIARSDQHNFSQYRSKGGGDITPTSAY